MRRKVAEAPKASGSELNEFARDLLTIEPVDLRDPVEALSAAKKAVAKSDGTNPAMLNTLALAQQMNGMGGAALETERTAVALLPAGPSPLRTELEANLAMILTEQEMFAEAEPLLLALHDQISGMSDSFAERRLEVINRIIALYESWHKAEPDKGYDAKAAMWRAEVSALGPARDMPARSHD